MPLLLPQRNLRKGRRPRVARGSRPSNRVAAGLYAELTKLCGPMVDELLQLAPWLESRPGPAIAARALQDLIVKWDRILGPSIRGIAGRWVHTVSEDDRIKLQKSLAKAVGVEFTTIFDDDAVRATAELMGEQAVHLIKTVPSQYLNDIQLAVMESYQQKPLPEGRTLTEQIQFLTGHTFERAKLIAVDQTNKMHGIITQTRQQSLGIEEYIWRTSRDQRVVGAPGGLYPKGNAMHGNHWIREGVKFRWDEPPDDGHPGWAIRCRCHAEPVIDYDKLVLQ